MLTLGIIGCGKLGQTLAHLWHRHQTFNIGPICTRHISSSQAAVDFIGAGTPLTTTQKLPSADVWLIATPDTHIPQAACSLVEQQCLTPRSSVFHCSGALSSHVLETAKQVGATIASLHPVHSFARPADSITTFAGSFVAYEGDKSALDTLLPAFSQIGANLLAIETDRKSLYHSGSVIACNYLVTLLDAALQAFAAAGIDRKQASQLLKPLVLQTAANVLEGSPTASLTGPISRGDDQTVTTQLAELGKVSSDLTALYRLLGQQTVPLAEQQGHADHQGLERIKALFSDNKSK